MQPSASAAYRLIRGSVHEKPQFSRAEAFCNTSRVTTQLVAPQIPRDQCKLIQRGLQILYDLGGDDVGRRQIGGIFQAFIAQPEDVQAGFVPFD